MDCNRDIFSGPLVELTIETLQERPFAPMEYIENGWFGRNDSAVYYSMVKMRNPRRLIEVGSGYSTRIADQACKGTLVCIDPSPRADVGEYCDHLLEVKVQTLDPQTVADCDMLFIDSSHIWGAGDLPFLFGKVFPLLKAGTAIHFHDIFLPDDYSPAWAPRHYDEQYHLRDFLNGHPEYQTLWPGYYMATRRTQEVIDIFGDAKCMGSFWMVKC
jgi:predicted O-methyltransferase YrrM